MTLKEVIDNTLAIPDEKTVKQNIDFLQNVAKNLQKPDQQKMQAVIDGMQKSDLAAKQNKQNKENAEEQKKQQVQQPQANLQTPAQMDNNAETAQIKKTSSTAQPSNT